MNKSKSKIFISPFKGGSTSVAVALDMVGFKRWNSTQCNQTSCWWLDELSLVKKRDLNLISETNKAVEFFDKFQHISPEFSREIEILLGGFLRKIFGEYNVADDYPLGHDLIHPFIKKIIFKEAKFVFIERPIDEYLDSVKKHVLNKKYKHIYHNSRKLFCESSLGNMIALENYKKWKRNYIKLKKSFPKDVLIMKLEDGWRPLSSFFEFKIPNKEFPRFNFSESRKNPCVNKECGHEIIYCEQYDSEYCPICLEWIDEKCGEKECSVCINRPEKPINLKVDSRY